MPFGSRSKWLWMLMLYGSLSTSQAVHGQMSGSGRSLGGYGASTISSYYGSTSGGYLPYANGGGGFVPYRGSAVGVQPIARRLAQTSIGGMPMAETPIGGASVSGGMNDSARAGMGMGAGSRRRAFLPFGSDGLIGMGSGMNAMPAGRAGMRQGRSGPGFGFPFRMPSPLPGSSSMGMP